jgi:glycosyltransferase involved in cell wall biosynthesis
MNLLVIMTSRPPRVDGDYIRFKNLFPLISNKHRLTLLYLDAHPGESYLDAFSPGFSSINVVKYRPDDTRGARVIDALTLAPTHSIRRRDPELLRIVRARIKAIIEKENISLIHSWVRSAEQFVEGVGVPVLFDLCDAMSLQDRERLSWKSGPRAWLDFLRTSKLEQQIVSRFPVTFVAARDAGRFHNPKSVAVIPNGVDLAAFCSETTDSDPSSILFSGSMSFPPNVDAVRWFAENVWQTLSEQRPNLRWYIVGADPAPEVRQLSNLPNVVVTGFVPEIRPYLTRTQIVIVPMVSGSGIKNKVLEAMACERAVVSTPLGIEGIDAVPGRDVEIAAEPAEFATRVLRLLEHPEQSQEMGRAARRLVESRYSWHQVVEQYDRLYRSLRAESM